MGQYLGADDCPDRSFGLEAADELFNPGCRGIYAELTAGLHLQQHCGLGALLVSKGIRHHSSLLNRFSVEVKAAFLWASATESLT